MNGATLVLQNDEAKKQLLRKKLAEYSHEIKGTWFGYGSLERLIFIYKLEIAKRLLANGTVALKDLDREIADQYQCIYTPACLDAFGQACQAIRAML